LRRLLNNDQHNKGAFRGGDPISSRDGWTAGKKWGIRYSPFLGILDQKTRRLLDRNLGKTEEKAGNEALVGQVLDENLRHRRMTAFEEQNGPSH